MAAKLTRTTGVLINP